MSMRGALWTDDEKRDLRHRFFMGMDLIGLAKAHHRTGGAIIYQLRAMGLIAEVGFAYHPVRYGRRFATWNEVSRLK